MFQLGWAEQRNGALLALAEGAGFDVFVTTDQNIPQEHHLAERKLVVVVLGRTNWPELAPHAEWIAQRIATAVTPGLHFCPIPPP